jgi:excisionase family DNA binding protein
MAEEKLLTIREVSMDLGVSEQEVMNMAESGALPAYKIGGVYLRFKSFQIEEYKRNLRATSNGAPIKEAYSSWEKVSDFLYFNDFYILSAVLVVLILVVIFQGY